MSVTPEAVNLDLEICLDFFLSGWASPPQTGLCKLDAGAAAADRSHLFHRAFFYGFALWPCLFLTEGSKRCIKTTWFDARRFLFFTELAPMPFQSTSCDDRLLWYVVY